MYNIIHNKQNKGVNFMGNLSKENFDKLDTNLLYKTEPTGTGGYTDIHWCKNWTFKVHKYEDKGTAWMIDTYFEDWDSHRIEVTDDNIDKFEIVFDFRNVERVSDYSTNEYEDADLFCVATDSGGSSCGHLYWKNKSTKKSIRKQLEKKQEELKSSQWRVESAERNLQRFIEENNINVDDYKEDK